MMMPISADVIEDGRTVQELFAVTRTELAAKISSKMLVAAAQDDTKQFTSWVKKTRWPQLPDQIAGELCSYLQENVVSIFAGAWAKYAELKRSARETCEHPETTETVALGQHDFSYEITPQIDVLLDRVKVATIPFQLGITFALSGLELVLKKGAVCEVMSGTCDCKAEIRCAGSPIWERTLRKVNLPGELELTRPIVLARARHREPATVEA
jgi:hypothetical protein